MKFATLLALVGVTSGIKITQKHAPVSHNTLAFAQFMAKNKSKSKQGPAMPTPGEFAEFLMGHGDVDGNGALSLQECFDMFDAIAPPDASPDDLAAAHAEIEAGFVNADTNPDGQVTHEELTAFLASLPPPSPEDIAQVLMWLADTDQSGSIDASEGEAFLRKILPAELSAEEVGHIMEEAEKYFNHYAGTDG